MISFLTYEQTTAVEEAETLGLKVTVKHVYSDALAGTVVEQSIAQDTVVTTGAEIVLTVSDGPDPSVSGTEGFPGDGVRGRIKKALSGFYYVDTGEEVVTCRARGRFRKEGVSPLVGDRVEITVSGTEGMVDAIESRRNVFSRPAVANIDQLVIVASNAIPQTDPYLIDRMTAIAALKGCEVLICINKSDLDHADELCAIYEKAGLPFLLTSAETGEGIAELRERISGKLSAFTGNSGVGKSSLLNALDPRFSVQVGEVSQALGRGRHTTRHVELYTLSGGAEIIDTPGFSSFDTDELGLALKERAPETFFGLRALSGRSPLRWLQPHEGKGLRRSGGRAGREALRLAARELSAALQRAQRPAGVEQQMKKRKRRGSRRFFHTRRARDNAARYIL